MDNLIVPLISYYCYGIIQHGLKIIKSLKRHVAQSHAWSSQKPVQHLTHTNDISQALTNTFETHVRGPKWIRVLIHLPCPFHCIYTNLDWYFQWCHWSRCTRTQKPILLGGPCIDVPLHIILRAEFFSFFFFPFLLFPFLLRENLSKDKA